MIRWLHISDLHFNNDDMSTDSMREELPKYLKKNNIRCDYVFCTGDIRTANAESNHFPDEAARFLIDLCTAVGNSAVIALSVYVSAAGREKICKRAPVSKRRLFDWNTRKLPFPVMEHIRNLSGRYWIGLAERVHDAGKNREDAFVLVENLLDCFPYTEAGGCPDYSGLDLRGLQIPDVEKIGVERISLREAKIDNAWEMFWIWLSIQKIRNWW